VAVLTDTNILLRLLQPHHPHCQIAERALDILRARNEVLNVTSQNVVEFWAASTRPFGENGLGLTIEQASKELDQVKRFWALLPEVSLLEEWERLVKSHRIPAGTLMMHASSPRCAYTGSAAFLPSTEATSPGTRTSRW
jgi:predicted nucleic acid-binding protein